MKNLIFTLLNKTLSSQTPGNEQKTVIEITELGKTVLGIVIGVVITLCVMCIVKAFKKNPDNDDNNHNNDDYNNDAKN